MNNFSFWGKAALNAEGVQTFWQTMHLPSSRLYYKQEEKKYLKVLGF
jgi:hypothetical protein